MWHLIEAFFEQSWVVKLFNLWGWLCVLIMVTSIAFGTDFTGALAVALAVDLTTAGLAGVRVAGAFDAGFAGAALAFLTGLAAGLASACFSAFFFSACCRSYSSMVGRCS